jgi:hypothetical protein
VTRIVALPYLTADPNRVAPGAWIGTDGQRVDLLPDWDYGTEVRVTRALEIDLEGVREDCSLERSARLAITVVWRATRTAARGALPATVLPAAADHWAGEIRLQLDGAELGGELRLMTRLVLATVGNEPQPLAPHLVGSVLWEDRHTILLEGGGARFPMEVVDFAAARLPAAGAAWYLHWPREDLHQPVMGALRLYVNDGHPMMRALLNGELTEDLSAGVVSTMRYDAVRSLVTAVLADDEFVEDPMLYQDGSVGALLRRLLNAYWPDQSVISLRNHATSRPEAFNSELQERMRLLRLTD